MWPPILLWSILGIGSVFAIFSILTYICTYTFAIYVLWINSLYFKYYWVRVDFTFIKRDNMVCKNFCVLSLVHAYYWNIVYNYYKEIQSSFFHIFQKFYNPGWAHLKKIFDITLTIFGLLSLTILEIFFAVIILAAILELFSILIYCFITQTLFAKQIFLRLLYKYWNKRIMYLH